MVKTKFFLSFIKEKKWLEEKNSEGYELETRKGFAYHFKKTDVPVIYSYVFLKKGKKSYIELDYKSKDKDAKAVYGSANILLLKKPASKGEIAVLATQSDKILNAMTKRTSLNSSAILYLALALCFTALSRVLSSLLPVIVFASVIFILFALYNLYMIILIDKYIKSERSS